MATEDPTGGAVPPPQPQQAGGETDLDRLLTSLQPVLQPGTYAFCTLPPGTAVGPELEPLGTFREAEGLTVILSVEAAERQGLRYQARWAQITLPVHSSLEAVGLIAAVASRLAAAGIACNPVAGFYHDHLFVPEARREEALAVLLGQSSPIP
jgi:hypothetical protein